MSYPRAGQDERCVREYVLCRLDGNDARADKIWLANPDLQDKMVVAIMEEKRV